jgi:hypothetical protein
MPTRHPAGARAVKVLAVALAISTLGFASSLGAHGFESDVNTIQTDLRDAYQRDFFVNHNDLFPTLDSGTSLDHVVAVREAAHRSRPVASAPASESRVADLLQPADRLDGTGVRIPITMLLALTASLAQYVVVSAFASSSESRKSGWAF